MIFEKVKQIVVDQLGVENEDVTLESSLDELGVDDLDKVEILMAVEEEFDIEIPDNESESISTVGNIVDCVKSKVNE